TERQNRYFSESFKRAKVKDIEKNLITIAEICRTYEVRRNSVYKWIYKYSVNRKRGHKQVIELMSDTRKIKNLEARVRELEQIIGQKQLIIDFKEKMIDVAEEMYGVDIKKKLGSQLSSGSGLTGESTPGE